MPPIPCPEQKDKLSLLNYLLEFLTEERKNKFLTHILFRTRYLTIALEDIYQPHNASAVLRSCDCFGIQDVHIIENRNKYQVNPDVALGASKWLTLEKYSLPENNTISCLENLKKKGYKVFATTPHENDYTPESLPLENPVALVFGNELEGLSDEALSMADGFIKIPMVGFTESLNISVSAAVIVHTLSVRLRSSPIHWQLPEEARTEILLSWAMQSIKKPELLSVEFFKRNFPIP